MTTRSKPITVTKWINEYRPWITKITEYPKPQELLTKWNIFATHYIISQQIELDILRETIDIYRQKLLNTQKVNQSQQSNNACQWITNQDIVILMSEQKLFIQRIAPYDTIKNEQFTMEDRALACAKVVACFGWSKLKRFTKMTIAQDKATVCDDISSQVFALYDRRFPLLTFSHDTQYNNLFTNGTWADSVFDLMQDLKDMQELRVEKAAALPQFDRAQNLSTKWSTSLALLPDELIASTQQLLSKLQLDTVIDPREDAQIASLLWQATTISWSSAVVPTGSILNACIDPASIPDTARSLIDQLKLTQESVNQYSQSLNTNQTLNNAINGSLDPSSLVPQAIKLSALNNPTMTVNSQPIVDLSANPLWDALAKINDDTVVWQGGWWGSVLGNSDTSVALWAKTWADTLKQCVWWCRQKYNNHDWSACVKQCEASWQWWWLLDARRCNQICFNAKIACAASCLCGSTVPKQQTWEVAKIHEMFEVRWCVVPTNKLRGLSDATCIRVDPITWIKKPPSIQCLLDKTIDYAEYNRESGKWWIRVKPREWYQLPNKFDLKTMIRFPVNLIWRKPRNDEQKKKDIKESQTKQKIDTIISQDPTITNLTVIDSSSEMIQWFSDTMLDLWSKMTDNAKSIEQVVQW